MAVDYKAEKEAFVSGMDGSSILHINLISLNALASLALYYVSKTRIAKPGFILEFAALVVPLLLSVTLFAEGLFLPIGLLAIQICTAVVIAAFVSCVPSPPPLSPNQKPMDSTQERHNSEKGLELKPVPAVTAYRAHMMLMTIICILAVDFKVFPRQLAKTETWGVSIMDLGVGSFVFSSGLVSAIPLLKHFSLVTTTSFDSKLFHKLLLSIRKTSPILLLGLIRVALVKGTDYPEHVSEYGTHWNFFLTLALLPPLQIFIHPLVTQISLTFIGLSLVGLYQVFLQHTPLQNWVLNAPRSGLISHNKEGLFSLPGYLAIHVLGLMTGTLVFPSSPSSFRRSLAARISRTDSKTTSSPSNTKSKHGTTRRNDVKLSIELFSYAIIWWSLLYLSRWKWRKNGDSWEPSRRLANLPYVLWVTAYNTSFLLGYLILDLVSRKMPGIKGSSLSSPLLEAINLNSLVVFLLANVFTGLVNLSMQTMYATSLTSIGILVIYLTIICGICWALRGSRLVQL